jgi:transcriptional regulator with XRE-family HTH domain
MMTGKEDFGDLLRRLRGEAGLTQEQLAEMANVSESAIRSLERGSRTRPRTTTIRSLAAALRLRPAEQEALSEAVKRASPEPPAEDVATNVPLVHGRLTIPIDVERDTRWALVELLYGLQRDARRSWRQARSRLWWRLLLGTAGLILIYGAGAVAGDRFNILRQLVHLFG